MRVATAKSSTEHLNQLNLGCGLKPIAGHVNLDVVASVNPDVVQANIVFEPGFVNEVMHRIAARWPRWHEARLAWIFPAWFLRFQLRVCKDTLPR